jgi:hypothetical protein
MDDGPWTEGAGGKVFRYSGVGVLGCWERCLFGGTLWVAVGCPAGGVVPALRYVFAHVLFWRGGVRSARFILGPLSDLRWPGSIRLVYPHPSQALGPVALENSPGSPFTAALGRGETYRNIDSAKRSQFLGSASVGWICRQQYTITGGQMQGIEVYDIVGQDFSEWRKPTRL